MIYADLKGRLGNQMFIYAFAYTLSKENKDEGIRFCGAKSGNCLVNYRLRNVDSVEIKAYSMPLTSKALMKLYAKKEKHSGRTELYEFEGKHKALYTAKGLYLCQNGYLAFKRDDCKKSDIFINGFFQSEKYFEKVKNEIREIFTPTNPVGGANLPLFHEIQDTPEAVCVDFRLGDYMNNPLHGLCTFDYYKRAIEYMKSKLKHPIFYVFSTDIDYVEKQLKNCVGGHFVFEDGRNSDYEKLRLMSSCKHFIITNSTYDWWAQYLSENTEKIVVAPSKWFAQKCPCDIYLNNWILQDC